MTESNSIEFWFDFASTYSYLSAQRIEALARESGAAVVWRPFLLGPVFQSLGWNDSPFNIYPPKGRYMWRDIERLCAKQRLPFTHPSQFPRNGLLAARVVCAHPQAPWVSEFVPKVFAANFAEDQDISARPVLGAILASLGQAPDAIFAAADAADNKAALRRQGEEAMQRGIFGAPSFIVAGELFWGNDRLDDALAWLRHPSSGAAAA